jgi:hypothetical protein
MAKESENQPEQPAPNPNKKFIRDLIEEKLPKPIYNFLIGEKKGPAVSEFVTSKQVSITLQGRGAGSGGGSP